MKTQGISFYFVLYIVAVISVFIITMERDKLLKERDEDISHLVELYVKPLKLTPYQDTTTYYVDPSQIRTSEPVILRTRVEGPIDRGKVAFSVVSAWKEKEGDIAASSLGVTNNDGDGILSCGTLTEGTYHFRLAGYSQRIVADGNEIRITIKDSTYVIPYSPRLEDVDRDTVTLIAKVEKSGTDPLQFRLSVQDREENWILGPPYQKKIFLTGIEEIGHVTFSSPPGVRVERTTDKSGFVTMTWDKPVLGNRTFTISANANRGFGGKDLSSVTFSVSILPPSFVSTPADKWFWGVPYTFDGRIQGLNPVDLSITLLHDNEILSTGSATEASTFVPGTNWSSMQYKVLFRGHLIKEHNVSLTAPPPPQVHWVGQNLDRSQNVFRISLSATDAASGPVRLSIESQPSGIARLDKISGKDFAVTVSLETNPTAVFLKVVASDKYGGRSVSTKQFNIPR